MAINTTALEYEEQGFNPERGPNCPYCGSHSLLRDNRLVYPHGQITEGKIWVCSGYPDCDSYVGVHRAPGRFHNFPLGRLADAPLRTAKKIAHNVFDQLWQTGEMSRSDAYKWLSDVTGLPSGECHIGEMTLEQCNIVYVKVLKKLNIQDTPINSL